MTIKCFFLKKKEDFSKDDFLSKNQKMAKNLENLHKGISMLSIANNCFILNLTDLKQAQWQGLRRQRRQLQCKALGALDP